MTAPTPTACDWPNKETGEPCGAPGTVSPKRWIGCLCEEHGARVEVFAIGWLGCVRAEMRELRARARQEAEAA